MAEAALGPPDTDLEYCPFSNSQGRWYCPLATPASLHLECVLEIVVGLFVVLLVIWREPTSVWWVVVSDISNSLNVEKSLLPQTIIPLPRWLPNVQPANHISKKRVFYYLSLEQNSFLHINTFCFGLFFFSLNIYWFFFFFGKQPRREDHSLFCLEPYQEMFTISENHITDSNATSYIWWPIKMIYEGQYHTVLAVACVAVTFMVLCIAGNI